MKRFLGMILGFLALVLPFGLYLRTLSPSYLPVDSAEFALCIHFWGICHPPGFPLYTLLGKIFTDWFPFGTLIYKANLFSAIFGAGTVFLIYLAQLKLGVNRLVAFLLSLIFAVSLAFWEFAISADVFTFASFLTTLAFLLAFYKKPFLAFFILGLSASHFYISAILAPLFVWYLWRESERQRVRETESQPVLDRVETRSGRVGESEIESRSEKTRFHLSTWLKIFDLSKIQGRTLLVWGIVFSLGFFPQAILFWRMQENPQINWGHAQGFWGFVDFVRRKEFGSMFLITNPVLTFSLIKVFKHFYLYFANLLLEFGIILPVLAAGTLTFGKLFKRREVVFLTFSFLVILTLQLVLLSTIDPTGADNSFQINKFYIFSFTLAVILMGIAVDFILKKFFTESLIGVFSFLSILLFIYLVSNFKQNDLSGDYFSQNLVLDALGQLPKESVAITLDHVVYFGGLYEQKISGNFADVKLLYFPNEKNRDVEKYYPEFFQKEPNSDFVNKITKGKVLGKSETYILETISRNLDKPIYILQGSFEEGFFAYLKPYIKPYGLWWKVSLESVGESESRRVGESESRRVGESESQRLLENLRNENVKRADLKRRQQANQTLTYAVSYHSTAISLARVGKTSEALELLKRSSAVDPGIENVKKVIDLISRIKFLEEKREKLIEERNKLILTELGNDYFTIGNYQGSLEVFAKVCEIDPKDAKAYNNLASSYAALGRKEEARANYEKALQIDPKLDLAKNGLEALNN